MKFHVCFEVFTIWPCGTMLDAISNKLNPLSTLLNNLDVGDVDVLVSTTWWLFCFCGMTTNAFVLLTSERKRKARRLVDNVNKNSIVLNIRFQQWLDGVIEDESMMHNHHLLWWKIFWYFWFFLSSFAVKNCVDGFVFSQKTPKTKILQSNWSSTSLFTVKGL
jgi:hypothetical protein